jgi:hypothetical protein
MSSIYISVDNNNLLATVDYTNASPKVINTLKLLLLNSSENAIHIVNAIQIPWPDLKRIFIQVIALKKTDSVSFTFNEFANTLIKEFVDDWKNLKSGSRSFEIDADDINAELIKTGFGRTLTKEQIRDCKRLLELKHGANFSVPGAGKTTTILAVHHILHNRSFVNKLFVVCPINAFISWQDETADIFGSGKLKVTKLTTNIIQNPYLLIKEKPDIVLVNYEKLRKDSENLIPFFLNNKVHIILDESHRVKSGANNLSYNEIKKLADISYRRDILSGTPMPQGINDLVSQFDILWSEKIIPNVSQLKDENQKITLVNEAIKDKFVRTTKNELGLKDPIIKYSEIPLGSIQTELYSLLKSEAARILAGMDKMNKETFRKTGKSVMRLLQAATNPMLLGTDDDYRDNDPIVPLDKQVWFLIEEFTKYEKPAKVEYLKSRVQEILSMNEANKIVLWSSFVRNITLLEKLFKEYNPVSIYGAVPSGSDEDEEKREGRIRKFHEDKTCRIIIANPQACGEGISLHKVCHFAIYLDRTFNAAHFLQSIDRIHRLGLSNEIDTNVEILVARGTIDELLIRRLNEKIENMGKVLNDKYLSSLAYDPFDISQEDEFGIDSKDFVEIKKHITGNEV